VKPKILVCRRIGLTGSSVERLPENRKDPAVLSSARPEKYNRIGFSNERLITAGGIVIKAV
jgi:hypothetical protein